MGKNAILLGSLVANIQNAIFTWPLGQRGEIHLGDRAAVCRKSPRVSAVLPGLYRKSSRPAVMGDGAASGCCAKIPWNFLRYPKSTNFKEWRCQLNWVFSVSENDHAKLGTPARRFDPYGQRRSSSRRTCPRLKSPSRNQGAENPLRPHSRKSSHTVEQASIEELTAGGVLSVLHTPVRFAYT